MYIHTGLKDEEADKGGAGVGVVLGRVTTCVKAPDENSGGQKVESTSFRASSLLQVLELHPADSGRCPRILHTRAWKTS